MGAGKPLVALLNPQVAGYRDESGDSLNFIQVSGDRQAGKSHLLRDTAILAAAKGKRVAYFCPDLRMARHWFFESESALLELPWFGLVSKTYRANGQWRIEFASGGSIRFISVRSSGRGCYFDVVILDEVEINDALLPVFGRAERVYQSVLTGGDDDYSGRSDSDGVGGVGPGSVGRCGCGSADECGVSGAVA
ncbi:hypothetical protein [Mycobacteroides abscessus]|uniref:hypothetical protein n=1 Tax=Mycobacteroides abscessus TaxID=36809 RepID=UPI0009D4DAF6|nr:hypothetical protein [Mycobacteroides abscessus]SKT45482.1 Uncharacterised protein [Mycobacteroides abscessus subsp. bolletii]